MTGWGTVAGFNAPVLGDPESLGNDTCVNDGHSPGPLYACTAIASTPTGLGYWITAGPDSPPYAGLINGFGNAALLAPNGTRTPVSRIARPVIGATSTADGHGVWQAAADGGVFAFGDARFYGSAASLHLNQPVVGIAATPTGLGYWLAAADGGVFAFGDARFYGSAANLRLNQPVVGITAAPDGDGYWLVAKDGGVFNFGPGATFHGSAGGIDLNAPVVGMAADSTTGGYWLAAADGGVFAFGGARYYGSLAGQHIDPAGSAPIVGIAAKPAAVLPEAGSPTP